MARSKSTMTLAETFRQLAQPTTDGTFTASPLPNSPSHKVGKDHTGAPCLLLTVQDHMLRPAPIQLEHLSIEHNTRCTIRVDQAQGNELKRWPFRPWSEKEKPSVFWTKPAEPTAICAAPR